MVSLKIPVAVMHSVRLLNFKDPFNLQRLKSALFQRINHYLR
jgi:hypothetical protein